MLVFRFGKDLEKIGFCQERVVFQNRPGGSNALDGGVSDAPGVDAAPPVAATLAPAAPEVPVVAAREAGAAAVENKGKKGTEVLKADIGRDALKAALGANFEQALNTLGTGFSGEIAFTDLDAALGFTPVFKDKIRLQVETTLSAVDFTNTRKLFTTAFPGTDQDVEFELNYARMMTALATNDLETKVKALHLEKFDGFKGGQTTIKYSVGSTGSATLEVNDKTGKYAEFEKAQQAAKGAEETAEQREAGKKEMVKAIKENGGWVGSLFLAFANSKDPKTGKTLIDRLYDGEVPALSVVFGARGVKYGKFEEMYANIKESAQDTKADGWIGKFEKAVGKGKTAALQETLALFQNTAGLSMESFKAYFDGTKALEDMYSLKEGYTAEAGKILKITLPKGTKMLVPPNTDYTVAIGSTAALAEKKAGEKPVEIEAVATRTLEVSAKALPPTTILPKGATVKEIA